uniref:Uncharacterized protein n=1 Tax=Arundo donax TaxID=35708 RepID=A0A0A9DUA6_ARUDO
MKGSEAIGLGECCKCYLKRFRLAILEIDVLVKLIWSQLFLFQHRGPWRNARTEAEGKMDTHASEHMGLIHQMHTRTSPVSIALQPCSSVSYSLFSKPAVPPDQ